MDTLLVYPNPWAAFDKTGLPCGVCPRDVELDAGGPGRFVGARLDTKNTKVLQKFEKPQHEIRSARQLTRYEFMGIAASDPNLGTLLAAKDPIEIPASKYYKERLREGSLLAANEATARAAKLPRFNDPKLLFASKVGAPPPETPGMAALPQSPDADGKVLEAPALPEVPTQIDMTPTGPDSAAGEITAKHSKRNRNEV